MENRVNSRAKQMTKAREWEKRRQIVIACLALLVVFCTGYVLSLPAIAMVRPASCGLDEHTHTEACYAEVATLVCGMDEQPGHTHGEGCFSPEGELVCGLTESAGHTHDESCYSTVKVLTCGLTEHVHTDACYAVSEEAAEEPAAGTAELSVGDTAEYAAPTAAPETEGAAETVANVEATAAPETEGATEPAANVEATAAPETEGAAEPAANVEATAAPETEGAADPAATAEPTAAPETVEAAPVSMPAQTFFGKTDDVAVYVEADEGAFPAETYMTVAPVVDETILNAAADTVDSEINSLCAVDICFFDNQNVEIQPQLPIRVTMATAAVMEPENTVVVHVDDTGAASPVENIETAEENVSFEAGSFSVYVIVGKETVSTHVITADGENYEITVTYGKESGLPSEGVTLKAVEIPESSEVYSSYVDKVDAALGEDKTVSHAKLFDISILVNGEKVQPQAPVQVSIKLQDMPVAEEQDVEVVHFEETEAASEDSANVKILSQDSVTLDRSGENVNSVEFSADGFSVYGVFATESLETTFLTADGETYNIIVNFGPDAGIPKGATLSVREIPKETDEFFEYYNKALKAAGLILTDPEIINETEFPTESTVEVHEMIPFMPDARFFDVSIMVDGAKFEPKAPVEVKVQYDDALQIKPDDTISSVHFTEDKNDLIEAQVSTSDGIQIVSHSQDGFSVTGDVVISMTGDADLNNPGTQTAVFAALRASETNAGPETTKNVTDNHDGTFTIRLNIKGEVEHQSDVTKANVIVILDTSGSMDDSVQGTGHDRWYYAVNAVNSVASTLLGKNGQDGNPNDLVEMALVTFSTTATTRVSSTTSASAISTALSRISPSGGTNWEDALQEAANVTFNNDGDATYVIFVSDGNPTFRNTRGSYDQYFYENGRNRNDWQYYNSYGVYGTGSEYNETVRRCYNEALDDAQALVNSGRQLYTIGAFGNVDRMQSLTTGAGAPANHYYSASNADALTAALNDIAEAIEKNLGYTGVSTTDGITSLSSVSANVVQGQAQGFRYYKNNVPWADAPEAEYENSAVTWDLSSLNEPLEDGVIYSIEFDVWPSQDSYDLIADLNNGLIDYDTLDPAVKEQINNNGGSYSLKTNTSLTTTYTKNGVTGTDEWDKGENSMELPTKDISIRKIWNNDVDNHIGDDTTGSVQLYLTKDGANYLSGDDAITVAPENPGDRVWVSTKPIYISIGLISQESDGSYVIRESGHDYSIAEPESFSYYWNLTSDVYRPMSINNEVHYLVLNDNAEGTDGTDYYVIEGHKYEVRDGVSELTATNDRRSNLNLTKVIDDKSDDQGADKNTLFDYTITVNNSMAATGSAGNLNSDHYVWFSVYDPVAGATVTDLETNATAETGDTGYTGYYYAESGASITVKLKEGWNLRFINLPIDTTYSITEALEDGWAFEKAEGSGWNYTTEAADSYDISVSASTVTGSIPDSNHSYTVTVTNEWESNYQLTVNKTWASDDYVTTHGTVKVALYKDGAIIDGSVREIVAPATSVTYENISKLDGLEVREVIETTTEGEVSYTAIDGGGLISVSGETTTLGSNKTDTYKVAYTQGTASENARIDTVTNTMPQLTVNKQDMSGKQLAGAKFKLTGEDKKTALAGYESITSSEDEVGNLLNGIYLSNGTYYLVETEAPAGYNILSYKIKITVSGENGENIITASKEDGTPITVTKSGNVFSFNVQNTAGVELPHTGGSGAVLYTLGGLMLLMASALMYGFRMRRRERRFN